MVLGSAPVPRGLICVFNWTDLGLGLGGLDTKGSGPGAGLDHWFYLILVLLDKLLKM